MLGFALFGWIIQPLVLAAASAVIAYLLHTHILDVRWYAAIARAGGIAFQAFSEMGKSISDTSAVAIAAMAGLRYMQDQMQEQIAKRGLTPEMVQQIVFAELSRLFGLNPAPAAHGTSTVTATAVPGQEATATVSDVPPRVDVAKLTAMSLD